MIIWHRALTPLSVPCHHLGVLSHIHLGFPCFFWVSGVSPGSSGSFACVAIAAHCCAVLCFQILFGLLSCSAHLYSLTRTSHWQGLGDHLESPCPVLSPPVQDIQFYPPNPSKMEQNALGGWPLNDHRAGVQDENGWENEFVLPGKEKAKKDITAPFHLARKEYREDGMRPFSKGHSIWTGQKGYKLHQKKSSLLRKTNSPRRWYSTKTRPRAFVDVHHVKNSSGQDPEHPALSLKLSC